MSDTKQSSKPRKERGLTLVYTGDGKGKTTAAIGVAVRAAGRGLNPIIIQFIKSPERTYGEKIVLDKLGIPMHSMGAGFTWLKTPEEHREALARAWAFAKERIHSGEHRLVVLDEINNALAIGSFPIDDVLPLEDVLETIRSRPQGQHLVLTGRGALPSVLAIADLVTEMKPEKHYYEEGVPAVLGIEF
ncbi:cob(I)yrinic acid a,c-diamide adenosyltransferase [Cohnella panacarvi]|uniref:cob(I)yrinic acid a,c-diamide adenosyltransferase n=1 Tax=Cohnella panacarvi TaxID=400776 RepID=UPI00047C33EC|nr:cob(I)yrinic acid a,c-diamide adenosyltransferase [Cohnella panacarvi]